MNGNAAEAVRWRRIERMVDRALEIDRSSRDSLLRELDAELADDALAWLRAMESTCMLDRPVGERAGELVGSVLEGIDTVLPGERVGSYRVVELLGEGGMGSVYRAERIEGDFEHQVAIKILRREIGNPATERRFRRERQILAALDHPNIARLFDGGTTGEGLPYFVMELVDGGRPVTEACDRQRLGLRERVELFLVACEAVAAAHRQLVVHLDLKPSNILVGGGAADAPGAVAGQRVKLVDFGISQSLESGQIDSANEGDARALTPLSASPELLEGKEPGTSSDVYQLGLVLFELLVGVNPQQLERSDRLRLAHVIGEITPAPPSEVARSGVAFEGARPVDPGEQAALRGLEPDDLARSLRGDLDAIVLTALRKSPSERYPSVDALIADLRAWLGSRPVSARDGGRVYRFGKWVRRERALAAASAVALTLLVSAAALAVSFAVRTSRDARLIARERDTAREVKELMVGLFEQVNPLEDGAGVETVTALQVLDRGVVEARRRLEERPAVLADLLRSLADSYRGLGSHDVARELYREALELHREIRGPEHEEVAVDRLRLAHLARDAYDHGAVVEHAEAALRIRRGRHPEASIAVQLPRSLSAFGRVMRSQGTDEEAWLQLEDATARLRGLREPDDRDREADLSRLAIAARRRGDLERAISIYRELIPLQRARHDAASRLDLGTSLNNLGFALRAQEAWAGAEDAYREALEIAIEELGAGHPRSLTTFQNLASVFAFQERYTEALEVVERQVAATRERFPDHWRLGSALGLEGRMALLAGELEHAERALVEAIAVQARALGADHHYLARPHTALGLCLLERGREEQGERVLARALSLYEANPQFPTRAVWLERDAVLAESVGRAEIAERFRTLER